MSHTIFLPPFVDDGTDISPRVPGRNIDLGTGVIKDNDVVGGVPLGDAGATTISTIAPSLVGGINENSGRIDFLEGIGSFTTKTDPALDAISVSDIDDFVGCLITLTAAGNDQNLPAPTVITTRHQYIVMNNDASTDNIDIIGTSTRVLAPGEFAQFIWDGSAWISVSGGTIIWIDDGTDIKAANSTRNLDLQSGGLKDNDVSTAIALGEAGETSFDTTNKSIVGSGNENTAAIATKTTGPASAVDEEIAVFDGTAGKLLKAGSGVTLNSDGDVKGMRFTEQDNIAFMKSGFGIKFTTDGTIAGALDVQLFPVAAGDILKFFHGAVSAQSLELDANNAIVKPTTQSTSPTTGALQVNGGVGIVKDVFIGGELSIVDDIFIKQGRYVKWTEDGLPAGTLRFLLGSNTAGTLLFIGAEGQRGFLASTGLALEMTGELLTLGVDTENASPPITIVTNESGYAAPSNTNADSDGDKWVFWNKSGYKGAIGFDTRTMWFQSTEGSATNFNRFKFFAGSAGVPVEILCMGDGTVGFKWNDTGIDIDFLVKAVGVADALFVDGANGEITLGQLVLGVVQADANGKLTSSPTLADGTLGTTQSPSDNSTKLATTAYVEAAVAVKSYAELYFNNNAVAQIIETANSPHGVINLTEGSLSSDWETIPGLTKTITAYADYSGTVAGKVKVTTNAAHTFSTGDYVVQRGSTNYNGVFEEVVIDANNYYIAHSWDGDDGASNVERPTQFRRTAGPTKTFELNWSVSVTKAAGVSATVSYVWYRNSVPQVKTCAQRELPGTDIGSISGGGIIPAVAIATRLFLTVESDNTNNLTMSHGASVLTEI